MSLFSWIVLFVVIVGIGFGIYRLVSKKTKSPKPDFSVCGIKVYWRPTDKQPMEDWKRLLPAILAKADSEGALLGFWKFGDLSRCVNGTFIECKPEIWYSSNGIKVAGEQYPGGILVVAENRIAKSALIHEWIHLVYQKVHGQIDFDHTSGTGHWTNEHNDYIFTMNSWIEEIQG